MPTTRFNALSVSLSLAALQLSCSLSVHAQASTPSFVIMDNPAVQETSPALTNQAFSKQWQIRADTDGKIATIEVLALDLPGQVFITHANSSSGTASTVLGEIKVFGTTAAFVDSVSITSKRAMKGAKLAISKTSESLTPSTDSAAFLLTEIVLFRKTALKKVIANGWADVVISDHVLFSKKKEDYPGLLDMRRLRAAAVNSDDSAPSFTVQEVDRGFPKTVASRQVSSNWTIVMPTTDILDKVLLDVQTPTPEYTAFFHVDSDLLPEGSIGTVEVAGGEIQVSRTQGNGTQQQETLVINAKPGSSANNANTSIIVNLAPTVELTNSSRLANPSATIFDDAVTLFLNGTGNLFVLANESFVYVDDVHFRVAGSGFLQVEIGEIRGKAGVSTDRNFFGIMTSFKSTTSAVIQTNKMCLWSATSYLIALVDDEKEAPKAADGNEQLCQVVKVPVKVGGSKVAAASGDAENSSKSSSASSSLLPARLILKSALITLVALVVTM